MNEARRCPKCQAELPGDAPQGLCPRCLLHMGLASAAAPGPAGAGATGAYGGFVPPSPQELAGRFPQLEILELIGQGGMGAVYKARQPGLDRFVAVKILPPQIGRDPAFAERFAREARALARLSHPHIVAVYDFGLAGELYYFLMEYVDGVNLRQLLRERKLQPPEALKIVPQICEALQFAHDEGIVHRDIKPENILLDKKGRVKIADFGLAKLLGRTGTDYLLTGSQQVMGTLHYMAPEQMGRPLEVDHRADIFSLGVVFYEMLTGELPVGRFEPPSRRVQVDVRLDEIVLRALENKPEQRYQHISDIKTQIESIASSPQPAYAAHGGFIPGRPGKQGVPAGAVGPMLLLTAVMIVLSGLIVAGGFVALAFAVLTTTVGSSAFWGWMGGAFGCIFGGSGGLLGCWNTYRQLEGGEDLMRSPRWTWLDKVLLFYGSLGAVMFLAGLVLSPWLNGVSTYSLLLMGGVVLCQDALLLIIRGLNRRAAQQEAVSMMNDTHGAK
jgi:tRNA A-37 threonylcarbamoyl transferase component Bud32